MPVNDIDFLILGFGFYRRDVWQRFDSLRQTEGGNKSDMDVCEDIQNYWINVTTEPDKYCPPQWVSPILSLSSIYTVLTLTFKILLQPD